MRPFTLWVATCELLLSLNIFVLFVSFRRAYFFDFRGSIAVFRFRGKSRKRREFYSGKLENPA